MESPEPSNAGAAPHTYQELLSDYQLDASFDEMFRAEAEPRAPYRALYERLLRLSADALRNRQQAADLAFLNQGITFTVYGDDEGTERIFPYDLLPRIITSAEWARDRARARPSASRALNLFLKDIYHEGRILADGRRAARRWSTAAATTGARCAALRVPRDIYVSVVGTDLIRLAGRHVRRARRQPARAQRRLLHAGEPAGDEARLPAPLQQLRRAPDRPLRPGCCSRRCARSRPRDHPDPTIVLLTPGVYNSAYFEHTFLARQMGIELVEGRDLLVHDNVVYMRTTAGLRRVDVIYRRVDDDFLDPLVFRARLEPGRARPLQRLPRRQRRARQRHRHRRRRRQGALRLRARDHPLLSGRRADPAERRDLSAGRRAQQREYVLEHLDELVVKAVGESGGYGMLIGPHSTAEQREEFRQRIVADPRNYIAQPTLALSRAPCFIDGKVEARHVDLRPYILYGDRINIVPGGLTRVALRRGSLVVNSSQGGGSKELGCSTNKSGQWSVVSSQ